MGVPIFTISEYLGCEITKPGLDGAPLLKLEDISKGDEVLIRGFSNYWSARITSVEGNTAVAEGDEILSSLAFAQDDRKAWVSTGVVNVKAISRIDFKR